MQISGHLPYCSEPGYEKERKKERKKKERKKERQHLLYSINSFE